MPSADFHRTLKAKGVGAKGWVNSFTEVEHLGGGKFAASLGGHTVFRDKTDGEWKKRKVTDNRPSHVLIQSSRCCVEVYPYYAKYFDVHHEEVRLHEERWVVQRWRDPPGGWWDVGAWNPVIEVEELQDAIKVSVTYDTDYGPLTVEYIQRDGAALKHNVIFQNTSGGAETFRVLARWAGIVGSKCNGQDFPLGTDKSTLRFHKADKPQREFTISENLRSMIFNPDGTEKDDQCLQRPVQVEAHAQGMKADFIYAQWVLNDGESLEIDPDITTITPPTEDANPYGFGGEWNARILIKFDISAIGPATASLAYLQLWQRTKLDNGNLDTDARFWNVTSQTWTEADAAAVLCALAKTNQTDDAAGFGDGNGAYYDSCDIDTIVNVNLIPGDNFCSIAVEDPDWLCNTCDDKDPYNPDDLVIGHVMGPIGGRNERFFESKEHAGGHDPKLYIVYIPSGWSGEISGVVNPAEVMGVAAADIAAVKGVA